MQLKLLYQLYRTSACMCLSSNKGVRTRFSILHQTEPTRQCHFLGLCIWARMWFSFEQRKDNWANAERFMMILEYFLKITLAFFRLLRLSQSYVSVSFMWLVCLFLVQMQLRLSDAIKSLSDACFKMYNSDFRFFVCCILVDFASSILYDVSLQHLVAVRYQGNFRLNVTSLLRQRFNSEAGRLPERCVYFFVGGYHVISTPT